MSEVILIWLYLSFGNFLTAVLVVTGLIGAVSAILAPIVIDLNGKLSSFHEKTLKTTLVSFTVVLSINCFYPSKEDLAWIIGGSVAINVAQMEEAQELPQNLIDAANKFLESTNATTETE